MGEPDRRMAVVTGGNRGLGLEVCRQLAGRGLRVLLTARDEAKGRAAAEELRSAGLDMAFHPLDVSDPASIERFAAQAPWGPPGIDVLVNNAGVSLDGFDAGVARRTLAVNFFGPLHLTDRLLPSLRPAARIVMVSSGLGALSCLGPGLRAAFADEGLTREALLGLVEAFVADVAAGRHAAAGWPSSAYRVSKVALNALTRILAGELAGTETAVNAVCPGWVRTAMGGRLAPRGVKKGAETIVWAATLPPGAPSGRQFRDRRQVPW